jgi:dimethylglycine dehydrogenase
VTEAVEEIRERRRLNLPHLPILRQPDIGFNVREEGEGLFMSLYETNTKPIFTHGPLRDFGMELLPADLEGIEAEFECFFEFQYSVHCSQRFLSQAR